MKLADLEIGREYAMAAHGGSHSHWNTQSVHVRLTGWLVQPRSPRQAEVELLEPLRVRQVGTTYTCRLKSLWWPWSHELERRRIIQETAGRREATAAAIKDALVRLGLHAERRMGCLDSLPESEVEVSGAELVKLADRADHLVELERLIMQATASGDAEAAGADGQTDRALVAEIIVWARAHDFSMLDGPA